MSEVEKKKKLFTSAKQLLGNRWHCASGKKIIDLLLNGISTADFQINVRCILLSQIASVSFCVYFFVFVFCFYSFAFLCVCVHLDMHLFFKVLFNLINFSTAAAEPSQSQATLAPQGDKKEGEVEESDEVIVQDNGDASKELQLKEIPGVEQLNALPTKKENAHDTKPTVEHNIQASGTAERELSNTNLHGPEASGLTDQDAEKQEALAVSMSHTESSEVCVKEKIKFCLLLSYIQEANSVRNSRCKNVITWKKMNFECRVNAIKCGYNKLRDQSQQSDIKKWNPYFSNLLGKQIR